MPLLLPRMTAATRRRILWLTAFAILACLQLQPFLRAQDVPAAPTPQSAPAAAQPQTVHLQDYSKPRSAFPHFLQPYEPQAGGATESGQLAAHRLAYARRQDLSFD